MKKLLTRTVLCTLFSLLFFYSRAFSQSECGTDQAHEFLMQSNISYRTNYQQFQNQLQQQLHPTGNLPMSAPPQQITIPVVVHVLHLGEPVGTGTNIPNVQIMDALNGINQRFSNIIGTGLDIEIQFCLATRDPNGNLTTGINRVDASGIPDYSTYGIEAGGCINGANENAVKSLSRWPVLNYYNIWIVKRICNGQLSGYAYYPNGTQNDGACISYSYFTFSSSIPAHELGHGLNLRHTFYGDNGTTCPVDNNCATDGDQICDTPPHRQGDCGTSNPCSASGIWDNSKLNYMSYCNPGTSYGRFTLDQKTRMWNSATLYPRVNLQSSLGCTTPTNLPCQNILALTCGIDIVTNFAASAGDWNLTGCSSGTPGIEKVYSFIAPATGIFQVKVSAISGGTIDCFYQSGTNCGIGGWACISPINTTGNFGNVALSVGQNYLFLFDAETSGGNSLTFSLVPAAPTSAITTSNCNGTDATLTATGGTGTYEWFTGTCGGSSVGTGSLIVSPPVPTIYYARSGSGSCSSAACANVQVTIIPNPGSPVSASASQTTICPGQTSVLSATGGTGTYYWVTDSCGGAFVGTGNPVVSPAFTTTYYVKTFDGNCFSNSCESVVVTVTNTVPGPLSAIASQTTICSGESTILTASGGLGTYHWFSGFCGGTPVGTGSPTVSPTSTTTYYARTFDGNCYSNSCASVVITVNPLPVSPTGTNASSTTICQGNSSTLQQIGGVGTPYWYTGYCGGTFVAATNYPIVSPSITTTYYVRTFNGTCFSNSCSSITINVNPTPDPPTTAIASPNPICSGSSSTLTAGGGTGSYIWFQNGCRMGIFLTGSPVVSPATTTNYYVATSDGTCYSSTCLNLTVTVNPLPASALSASASLPSICPGQSTTLSASGGTGTNYWYTGSCGDVLIGTGNLIVSPNSTTTYYVRKNDQGCFSANCASVTVTVTSSVVAPTSATATPATVCAGSSVVLRATGGSGTYYWYAGSCGGTSIATGTQVTVTPSATTTYFVRRYSGGCFSLACSSVTVTVNPLPPAPTGATASPATICPGASSTLSATGGTGTYYWYQTSCGGTSVGTGSPVVAPTTTTSYFVKTNNAGCYSSTCANVIVSIAAVPANPSNATASPSTICPGQTTTLSSTGTGTNYWYTGSCGGALAGTGNAIVSPSVTTTYYVRKFNGTCFSAGCKTVKVTVTSSVSAPTSATANPATINVGDSSTLTALVSGQTYSWFTGSCGGVLVGTSASPIRVSPAITTTYYARKLVNGCYSPTCKTVVVTVNPPLAPPSPPENHIDEMPENPNQNVPEIRIFPNPTKGLVFINIKYENQDLVSYKVTDLNGRILIHSGNESVKDEFQIDLNPYTSGIYLVEVIVGTKKRILKVIRE